MNSINYNDQVFINCSFDDKFSSMFHAFCFSVLDCGFIPRCSLEVDDATEFRLRAIVNLMKQCKYGVHDLSRVELDEKSKLPRFNMPFEFGIFYSAKMFGIKQQKIKKCLVLEKQKYRYQKFISDISGIDVTPHANCMKRGIIAIRNWLVTTSRRTKIPPAENIYLRYLRFQHDIKKTCKERGIDYKSMPFVELIRNMTDWLKINQEFHRPLFMLDVV